MNSKQTARRVSRAASVDSAVAPKRFLRRPELTNKIGLSASSIFALERAGNFPKHILLTPRCAVWDEAQVEAWMAERQAASVAPAFVPVPPRATKA